MKAILLNRILMVLAFAGIFVSGTLSLSKLLNIQVPCGLTNECEAVTSHPSAYVFGGPNEGIPVAYIGFIGYAILAIIAVIQAIVGPQRFKLLTTVGYIVAAMGAAFSLYLQYQALYIINATCLWCLASAITMVLTVVVYALLSQTDPAPAPEERRGIAPADITLIALLPLLATGALLTTGMTMGRDSSGSKELTSRQQAIQLIPERPNAFGDPNSPITVVEFADMCCGLCRTRSPEMKDFVSQNQGKVRLIYRHFPLLGKHQMAVPAAVMSEYAAEKNQFWDFTLAVMATPQAPEKIEELYAIAQRMGFDLDEIERRMRDTEDPIFKRMYEDMKTANELGLGGTPSFIIIAEGIPTRVVNGNEIFEVLNGPIYSRLLKG